MCFIGSFIGINEAQGWQQRGQSRVRLRNVLFNTSKQEECATTANVSRHGRLTERGSINQRCSQDDPGGAAESHGSGGSIFSRE